MEAARQGSLCTVDRVVEAFLAEHYDTTTGAFTFPRESALWDAVECARAAGKDGAGQRVAILDSGFDPTVPALAAAIASPSEFSTSIMGRHGTAVALLIKDIAPKATLILYNVCPGAFVHSDIVATRLRDAVTAGAGLVNMSLGFATDARRRTDGAVDVAAIDDLDVDPAVIRDRLRHRATSSAFFVDGGCATECEVCDALDALDLSRRAVVAAAGNTSAASCPACHHNTIGSGFEREHRTAAGIGFGLPTFEQTVWSELNVPQPDGFEATSFAAPLLTGLAALDGAGPQLGALLAVANAMGVVQRRHAEFLEDIGTVDVATRRATEILDEYRFVREMLPAEHRHTAPDDQPCATCGVVLINLYMNATVLALELGLQEEADDWLQVGLRICPLCPDLLINRAAFLRGQAEIIESRGLDGSAARRAEAASLYRRAAARRPSNAAFMARCWELADQAAAPG